MRGRGVQLARSATPGPADSKDDSQRQCLACAVCAHMCTDRSLQHTAVVLHCSHSLPVDVREHTPVPPALSLAAASALANALHLPCCSAAVLISRHGGLPRRAWRPQLLPPLHSLVRSPSCEVPPPQRSRRRGSCSSWRLRGRPWTVRRASCCQMQLIIAHLGHVPMLSCAQLQLSSVVEREVTGLSLSACVRRAQCSL